MAGALQPKQKDTSDYERGFAAGYKAGYESAQDYNKGGLIANYDKVMSQMFSAEDNHGEIVAHAGGQESKDRARQEA